MSSHKDNISTLFRGSVKLVNVEKTLMGQGRLFLVFFPKKAVFFLKIDKNLLL